MITKVIRMAGRRTLAQVQYVSPVPPALAGGLVAAVYAQLERDFGMLAPPVILHSPAPGPLAAAWLMLRETLLAGLADRGAKEAVAAAVSLGNTCPYCVQVHTGILHGLVRGRDAAAIETGRIASVTDPRIRQAGAWAQAAGLRDTAGQDLPFPSAQCAEFIGVAVTFHYLNRMVNVFLGDPPLPAFLSPAVRGAALRMLGSLLRPVTARRLEPGTSAGLLPEAPLPSDLSWAAGSPAVAGAFARAAATIDADGVTAVPQSVRELVLARLAGWDGAPPALGRAWVDAAISRLAAADRPAGRLALLTAMSSYQVRQADVDQARLHLPGDRALIGLTSWASMAAARQAGRWLAGEPY